jgi:tetratricopeptide (TPR) repeat protein
VFWNWMVKVDKLQSASLDAWENLAESALSVGRKGDTREALSILQGGIEAARKTSERRGEIIAMNAAALVHSIRGDFWAALAGSIDAFFMAKRENDRLGMGQAMTMLAGALLLMTPIDSEIELLRTSLTIGEEERNLKLQIRVHNLLGIVLGDLGRFDEAEMHLDLALVLAGYEEAGFDRWRVKSNIANLLRKRAAAANERGAAEECADYARRGLELVACVEAHCMEHDKLMILLDAQGVAALLMLQLGRHEAAYDKFRTARDLAIARKNRSVLSFIGLEMARLEIRAGDTDAAEASIQTGLREAALFRPSNKAAALAALMAEICDSRGERDSADHWRTNAEQSRIDFEALTKEARRQMARVAESMAGG